ncbi:MAG: NAD(P)/FAD-dependent oxidoreductase [Clostridiales bacterium]|nr:NAD(P)/FAD-dependent oxidoreductase [Clostridiales bacterium]
MFDCIIIGTGAAGVSAALTLKALNKNFMLLGSKELSFKIRGAEKIKNYPGLPLVSGAEMQSAFLSQLKAEGIEITEGKASGVYPADGGYSVMCGQTVYETKTVILATGVEAVKPVKGEVEFLGRGVSYCAVCDGFLYKGKDIAVAIDGDDEAGEVELLTGYARTIHLFRLKKCREIEGENIVNEAGVITEIKGDMRARAVVCGDKEIAVDGVFMLKQSVGAERLVHGLKAEGGHAVADKACATNLAGVFAAGDITGRPYQYAKAAGEGNVAAYSVNAYLNAASCKEKNGV